MLTLGPPPPRSPRRPPARSLRPGRAPLALPDLGSRPTAETPPPLAPPTASARPHFRPEGGARPAEGAVRPDQVDSPECSRRGPGSRPRWSRGSTPAFPPPRPVPSGRASPSTPARPNPSRPREHARERLQLFNSAAIFREADFPACLAAGGAGLEPLGRGRAILQPWFWARCHLPFLACYCEPQGNPFLVTFCSGWVWRHTPV